MITINEQVRPEIRIWRVANVMHANIPRTVVRQPVSIQHRPDERPVRPTRRELLDLALNIVNLFVLPQTGAIGDMQPVKCFRGHCSAFAARHHERFMQEFVAGIAETGGAIPTARIRAWIGEVQRERIELAPAMVFENVALSA